MQADFETLYGNLVPELEKLEAKRQQIKRRNRRQGLIAGGICFVLLAVFFLAAAQAGALGLLIAFVLGGIVFLVLLTRGSGELTAYYKDVVISRLVSGLCPGATYNPTQGIPRQTFVASSLFSTAPDRYSCEDHIAGCLDRTAFSCSEIHAEEKRVTRDSKGRTRTHWVTIFRGFFFIADFHKDFRGQTVVHRNSWIKFDFSNRRVKLENPAFEKRFDVYSTDQVEARYLLTPSMMEKLVALDDKFPGKITLSFTGSKVIVAIPDAMDHFETSIWKHQVQNDDIRREFSTLAALLGIVDDLNLNLRIWSKQ